MLLPFFHKNNILSKLRNGNITDSVILEQQNNLPKVKKPNHGATTDIKINFRLDDEVAFSYWLKH